MLAEIARKKFDREVDLVRTYSAQGRPGYAAEILHAEFPRLVVRLANPNGPPFILRVEAPDWDSMPASYKFVRPDDFSEVLPVEQWPGQPFPPQHPTHNGPFRNDNQLTIDRARRRLGPPPARPFICLEGTREYHHDERHKNDAWYPKRKDIRFNLNSMIVTIQQRIYKVSGVDDAGN